jgi:hypothetical protein
LEISTVNQLLVDMVLTSKCVLNENTDGILNKCFSYSEDNNSDSTDNKITELFLVLQPVLFYMPKFTSPVAPSPTA